MRLLFCFQRIVVCRSIQLPRDRYSVAALWIEDQESWICQNTYKPLADIATVQGKAKHTGKVTSRTITFVEAEATRRVDDEIA
jgi:hypothetical protein